MADFPQIKYDPAASAAFTLPMSFSRGAFSTTPIPGSSNLEGAIPLAGSYADLLKDMPAGFTESEAYKKDPTGQLFNLQMMRYAAQQSDPNFMRQERQQTIQDQLAYAKTLGDQMMKYRMTNDIIANLGSAARSAFARYTDPNAIAQMQAGVGDAYARGAEAARGLSQLGAGQPAVQYYRA